MIKKVLFAVLVILVPLVTAAWLMIGGSVVIWGRNAGDAVTLTAVTVSGRTIEKSEPRTIAAGGRILILFSPRIEGMVHLACHTNKPDSDAPLYLVLRQSLPLGTVEPGGVHVFRVDVNGCNALRML